MSIKRFDTREYSVPVAAHWSKDYITHNAMGSETHQLTANHPSSILPSNAKTTFISKLQPLECSHVCNVNYFCTDRMNPRKFPTRSLLIFACEDFTTNTRGWNPWLRAPGGLCACSMCRGVTAKLFFTQPGQADRFARHPVAFGGKVL